MKISKVHMRILKARQAGLTYDATKMKRMEPEGHYGKWGWEGRNKADKGRRIGSCNVTACQQPGAFWYNRVMDAWYCTHCAHEINYRPLDDGEYLCVCDEAAMAEYFAGTK